MNVEIKDLQAMMFTAESKLCEVDGKDASAYHLAFSVLLEVFTESKKQYDAEMEELHKKWRMEDGAELRPDETVSEG